MDNCQKRPKWVIALRRDAFPACVSDGIRTTIAVGEECVINVNAAEAGYGNVTCCISSSGDTDIDIAIIDNGDGTISIVYTPQAAGAYTINIKFGGQPVPNGELTQQVGLSLLSAYRGDAF